METKTARAPEDAQPARLGAGSFPSADETNAKNAVKPKGFLAELQRRNLYKIAVACGVVSWLLIQLATHGLFVVARTTAFSFKNKNPDIREIGRQLGVSHVLEGSVSHRPGKVLVSLPAGAAEVAKFGPC